MKRNLMDIAKFVIETEASALEKLAYDLPRDFLRTIEAILNTKGRVIVSGIGKSGHVGRKIAQPWQALERLQISCMLQKLVMVIWE